MSLLKNTRIARVSASAAAGQADVNSAIVDMAGYDGVIFIGLVGTVGASSTLALKAEQNDENSTTGMQELTGSASVSAGAGNSGKVVVLDVHKPRKRFVRAVLERGAADSAVDGMIAILYDGRRRPAPHDVSVIAEALIADPDPV